MRFLFKLVFSFLVVVVALGCAAVGVVWLKQDEIVQELITAANADFQGRITLEGSRLSPFGDLPYFSVDLQGLRIFEQKQAEASPVLEVPDLYVGLDVFTVLNGDFEIKSVRVASGYVDLVQYPDGSLNLLNALAPFDGVEAPEEDLHLKLQRVAIESLTVNKHDVDSDFSVSTVVEWAETSFLSDAQYLNLELSGLLEVTVLDQDRASFFHDKHIELSTGVQLDRVSRLASVRSSTLKLEDALFNVQGTIDLKNDANLDLRIEGRKDNFDLLLAFAPPELEPALDRYSNAGEIYFDATLTGQSANGHSPAISANFGCKDGYFNNDLNDTRLEDMRFRGHFFSEKDRGLDAMEFAIDSFGIRPEAGVFTGELTVKNFDSPDIDLRLDSDFDLDFLASFLNVENLEDLRGHVALQMNFHDIVDLANPETSIARLNESYYTELTITDLGFKSPDFHLPIDDIDLDMSVNGHRAEIEKLSFRIGSSDITLAGSFDDLPAVLHHTDIPVTAKLALHSDRFDLYELTNSESINGDPVNEVLSDLEATLVLNTSAKALTESTYLPVGDFLIERLNVTLQNYPHRLHDFSAEVAISEKDLPKIVFNGFVDDSDFRIAASLRHYDLWFAEEPQGDTDLAFNLSSNRLRLEDLFSYDGENYVPPDYRQEVLDDLTINGQAYLHFVDQLHSADISIENFATSLQSHEMRLDKVSGRVHLEDGTVDVQNLIASVGDSDVTLNLSYDMRGRNTTEHTNVLNFSSTQLNFDQLFSWKPPESIEPIDHDSVFSIFDVPFPDMTYDVEIARLNYHSVEVRDFKADLRSSREQKLFVDALHLQLADGTIDLDGYFSAADRTQIYLTPTMRFSGLDLDKLLLKFDNFGQDELVAENLHGRISGELTGNVHLHADLTPMIDDSELHLDVEILDGRLDDYEPLTALTDYFKEADLRRVAFDTLSNQFDVKNGEVVVPNMRINSSLGFFEVSGKQDIDLNLDYLVRVPWRFVIKAGKQKLFGWFTRQSDDAENASGSEIIRAEEGERVKFVNVRLTGNPDDYSVDLISGRKAEELRSARSG
ncbi:MAG: AsmA-like C-terminal region-containing protein [Pseudomonadota bacterium]